MQPLGHRAHATRADRYADGPGRRLRHGALADIEAAYRSGTSSQIARRAADRRYVGVSRAGPSDRARTCRYAELRTDIAARAAGAGQGGNVYTTKSAQSGCRKRGNTGHNTAVVTGSIRLRYGAASGLERRARPPRCDGAGIGAAIWMSVRTRVRGGYRRCPHGDPSATWRIGPAGGLAVVRRYCEGQLHSAGSIQNVLRR